MNPEKEKAAGPNPLDNEEFDTSTTIKPVIQIELIDIDSKVRAEFEHEMDLARQEDLRELAEGAREVITGKRRPNT